MAKFIDNLQSLGFVSYADYLKSPLWASIRSRVYASKGRICLDCKSHRATQIHHRQYDLETLKGDTLNYLVPVCRNCHRKEHGLEPSAPVVVIVIPWNPTAYRPRKSKGKVKALGNTKGARKQHGTSRKQRQAALRARKTECMRPPAKVTCTVCRKECPTPTTKAWIGFICVDCEYKPKFPELTRNQVKDQKLREARKRTEDAMERAARDKRADSSQTLREFMQSARMATDR